MSDVKQRFTLALNTSVIESRISHTRQDLRCRLCREAPETIQGPGFKRLTGKAYMELHNQIAGLIYRNRSKWNNQLWSCGTSDTDCQPTGYWGCYSQTEGVAPAVPKNNIWDLCPEEWSTKILCRTFKFSGNLRTQAWRRNRQPREGEQNNILFF